MVRHKLQWSDLFVLMGLDTSVLVDLILSTKAKEFFYGNVYQFEKNLIFTHRTCLGECLGLLIGNYGFSKEEARGKIQQFVDEFKVTILEREEDVGPDEQYVFNLGKKYGWSGDQIINDAIIIASFWRKGINMVVVRDHIFEKVCRELKITVLSFPLFT